MAPGVVVEGFPKDARIVKNSQEERIEWEEGNYEIAVTICPNWKPLRYKGLVTYTELDIATFNARKVDDDGDDIVVEKFYTLPSPKPYNLPRKVMLYISR
jgi:hypothetical protein